MRVEAEWVVRGNWMRGRVRVRMTGKGNREDEGGCVGLTLEDEGVMQG